MVCEALGLIPLPLPFPSPAGNKGSQTGLMPGKEASVCASEGARGAEVAVVRYSSSHELSMTVPHCSVLRAWGDTGKMLSCAAGVYAELIPVCRTAARLGQNYQAHGHADTPTHTSTLAHTRTHTYRDRQRRHFVLSIRDWQRTKPCG